MSHFWVQFSSEAAVFGRHCQFEILIVPESFQKTGILWIIISSTSELKTLRHIIENLKTNDERKERSFRQNRKKGNIFRTNAINKKGEKTFKRVATFPVKVE